MTYKLKISSQNQATLPVDLIRELGLSSGMYIYINPDGDDYKIINTRKKVAKLAGSLGRKIQNKNKLLKSGEEFEEILENAKAESFKNWKV